MKGLLSFLLGVVLFVGILLLTGTIAVRSVLSSNNLAKVAEAMVDPEKGKEEIAESFFQDIDAKEEFTKYVDNKEFKEAVGDYLHQFIMIKTGMQEGKIDTTKLRKFFESCAEKYNKENEQKLTDKDIDKVIENIEKEVESEGLNEEASKVFKVIYSKTLIVVSILAIVISFGLLDLINKKINTPILLSGIIFMIVGLIIFGIYALLNSVEGDEKVVTLIKDILISPIKIMSIVEFGLGIVLIVVSRLIKDNKTEFKEEVTN